ncbi:prolyl oligopeptidase family serine peptidase [Streptomyces sp. LP05-1]|uniref:Prolyl oligopeptidase family serine peptidase n=1 Tax=Streptomyces pyxinae TaxID=2970734 RepID=A0ABT2CM47_9ACTN|nr:prolyl oligopeptidase family serine peptidase [Streptomyces sp. LP05-1]MCS0638517.1 prolyl oligopeptidase family serine peptidase [Streptomyces sp. LP05-1]
MVPTGTYGAWPSPIDAALAAAHSGRPDYVGVVGDEVWWTEPRPAEGGRRALVRRLPNGTGEPLLPAPWDVRSRVIEYGGQPWAGAVRPGEAGPLLVFSHFPDQRLYLHEPGGDGEPRPLTPLSATSGGLRWADPVIHADRGEVWCVLEEFTGAGPGDVRRVAAAVPLDGSAAGDRGAIRELTDDSHRFVTGPRLSPDGRRAVWLAWDHPRMPWDGTLVLTGEVTAEGPFTGIRQVAGGPEESVCQADWAPDGSLLYLSDAGDWWEPYRLRPGADEAVPLCPGRAEEFGGPLWRIGLSWFQPLADGTVAVVHGRGATSLGILDPETGELVDAPGPWTEWAPGLAADGTRVVGVAASPRSAYEVVELDTRTGRTRVIGSPHRDAVDPAYYPEPHIRTFTGPDNREIHAHIYPPHNPDRVAPDDELPPYVVWAHGGPTGNAPLVLDLGIAYFTSRGIGVAQVNYGGSTGYGRAYRNRLREQWGVVDVEDCAAVAEALAAEGTADPARLAVRGGSAGGWTAAASLATTGVYACGTIFFPVLDLDGWGSGETHDFESRYLESLIGPFEEVPGRYRERSPIEHVDGITAPFLLLQGLDDVICPPTQSERFLARTAGRGVPHAYLAFPGEGHGFRRAETVIRALEAEMALYVQVFGIDRDDVPPLELRT